eukprot:scaffold80881_cov63-Phaeocystis_antarctica.AAC.4
MKSSRGPPAAPAAPAALAASRSGAAHVRRMARVRPLIASEAITTTASSDTRSARCGELASAAQSSSNQGVDALNATATDEDDDDDLAPPRRVSPTAWRLPAAPPRAALRAKRRATPR